MALNPKQRRFAEEYLVDLNAKAAAIRAGYSPRSAHVIGHRLLQKKLISDAIQSVMDRITTETEVSVERVLRELARIAFFDPARLYDGSGRLKHISELDPDVRAALQSYDMTHSLVDDQPTRGHTRFRLFDKLGALGRLMKYLGMLPTSLTVQGPRGGPIPLDAKHRTELTDEELEKIVLQASREREVARTLD